MWVRIQNFQSIKDIELEIEGLTAIVGPSNIGKSAIWRALFYSLHSKMGNDFVRYGEDFTRVDLHDGDFKMVWEKGEGVNRYFFQDDPTPYPKIKKGEIPQPILDSGFSDILLNGPDGKVKDRISAQFAPQVDGNVFLINSSPGTVSEVLSQLSRLDVLIRASRATDLDSKRVGGRIRIRQEDEERLRRKKEGFSPLPQVTLTLGDLQKRAASIQEARRRVSKVRDTLEKLGKSQRALAALVGLVKAKAPPLVQEKEVTEFSRAASCAQKFRKAKVVAEGLMKVALLRVPEVPLHQEWGRVRSLKGPLSLLSPVASSVLPQIPKTPELGQSREVKKVSGAILAEREKVLELGKQKVVVEEGFRKIDEDVSDLRKCLCDEVGECPLCGRGFS